MNTYFIFAIIFGALATICTIKGGIIQGKQSSDAQITAIEHKLESFGKNYMTRNSDIPLKEDRKYEIERINDYKKIAKEFYKMLPIKTAEKKANTAKLELDSLKKAATIQTLLKQLEQSIQNLVNAYNNSDNEINIKLEITDFPKDLQSIESRNSYHILMSFSNQIHWGIRFVTYPDQTLALQLVKLISPTSTSTYEELKLTNDSINLVFLDNKFGISLNSAISEEAKEFITKDIVKSRQEMNNFVPSIELLVKRIIEYEITTLKEKK